MAFLRDLRLIPLSLLVLCIRPTASITFDCKKIVEDKVEFKLGELGGYHEVSWIRNDFGTTEHNTTFKIDICNFLKLNDDIEKKACGEGTHICGVESLLLNDEPRKEGAFPIVRNWEYDNSHPDPKITRLKGSSSNADNEKEGLRLEVGGGVKEMDGSKRPQKAIIEFLCRPKDKKENSDSVRDEDNNDNEGDNEEPNNPKWEAARKTDDGVGGEIEFLSYKQDSANKEDTLRLNWYTPYGCEDAASSGRDSSSSGGWGFFSWFFFIVFMGLLAYIIFTAWINYTQHGARGWDLLPYSDTIRDVPYILGDWGRKIVSTLNGGGSRGGYSAV